MGVRSRAIITRIQTMRTSSLIALAIIIGLLIIYHVKQSDYEDRMSEEQERSKSENFFLEAIQSDKVMLLDKHNAANTDKITHEHTKGTIPDTEESEEDENYEQDEKDYSEDDDDNGDDEYPEDEYNDDDDDDENDDDYSDNKADDYDDEEDDGDEEDFGHGDDGDDDYDDDNINNEEDVDDYDDDEEDNDYDYEGEDVIDEDDGEDFEDDDDFDEENDDDDEYDEEDIENSTTTSPTVSDDDEEDNYADDIAENDATIDVGSDDEDNDYTDEDVTDVAPVVGKDERVANKRTEHVSKIKINDAIKIEFEQDAKLSSNLDKTSISIAKDNGYQNKETHNNFAQGQNIPQKQSREDQEILKKDLELLSKKYPETVEDDKLKTQSDNYIVRLRNKLKQIGRRDVIYKNHCTRRLPTSIIIGVMKCGTEAFATFLGIHPQIAMQFGYTAMDFFSNPTLYKNGLDWYKSRMMCSTPYQVTMEKSPQYFSAMAAPERIYRMDPDMKIVLLVRDPISRAVSHFLQQQNSHPERMPATTFEDSVYDKERKQVIGSSPYVFQSTYSVIYKRWLKYFRSQQIIVVDGDTFKQNPISSIGKVERFLGIDAYIDETKLSYNKEKKFFCLKPQSENSEDIEVSCLQGGKGRTHPDIKPEVLNALRIYFKPFNEEFIRLTGIRFDW